MPGYWGACDGLFTPRPLGPFLDIAGQLGGELAPVTGRKPPREELFAALLPSSAESDGPQGGGHRGHPLGR